VGKKYCPLVFLVFLPKRDARIQKRHGGILAENPNTIEACVNEGLAPEGVADRVVESVGEDGRDELGVGVLLRVGDDRLLGKGVGGGAFSRKSKKQWCKNSDRMILQHFGILGMHRK